VQLVLAFVAEQPVPAAATDQDVVTPAADDLVVALAALDRGTGVGCALDAVSRGLKTALVERDDFAAGTSSKSSKLVHGGLRYLELFDFGLVRESLAERQRLYESVKVEIDRMVAEERRRQAILAQQARARLEAQRLAAQQAAQAAQVQVESQTVLEVGTDYGAVSTPAPPPPDGSKASQVISIAMQYLGVPYVWGGMSPSGFDCSGLTAYAYAQIGISLPHHAASQFNYGVPVSRDDLQPADLVFFNGLGHMGMYIGGGQFIHAPHTGDVVKISSLYDSWYASTWVGARRVL